MLTLLCLYYTTIWFIFLNNMTSEAREGIVRCLQASEVPRLIKTEFREIYCNDRPSITESFAVSWTLTHRNVHRNMVIHCRASHRCPEIPQEQVDQTNSRNGCKEVEITLPRHETTLIYNYDSTTLNSLTTAITGTLVIIPKIERTDVKGGSKTDIAIRTTLPFDINSAADFPTFTNVISTSITDVLTSTYDDKSLSSMKTTTTEGPSSSTSTTTTDVSISTTDIKTTTTEGLSSSTSTTKTDIKTSTTNVSISTTDIKTTTTDGTSSSTTTDIKATTTEVLTSKTEMKTSTIDGTSSSTTEMKTSTIDGTSSSTTEMKISTIDGTSSSTTDIKTSMTDGTSSSTTDIKTSTTDGTSSSTTDMKTSTTDGTSSSTTDIKTSTIDGTSSSTTDMKTSTTDRTSSSTTDMKTSTTDGTSYSTTDMKTSTTDGTSSSTTDIKTSTTDRTSSSTTDMKTSTTSSKSDSSSSSKHFMLYDLYGKSASTFDSTDLALKHIKLCKQCREYSEITSDHGLIYGLSDDWLYIVALQGNKLKFKKRVKLRAKEEFDLFSVDVKHRVLIAWSLERSRIYRCAMKTSLHVQRCHHMKKLIKPDFFVADKRNGRIYYIREGKKLENILFSVKYNAQDEKKITLTHRIGTIFVHYTDDVNFFLSNRNFVYHYILKAGGGLGLHKQERLHHVVLAPLIFRVGKKTIICDNKKGFFYLKGGKQVTPWPHLRTNLDYTIIPIQ